MKRYRLKDQELQRRFDDLSNGEFSKNLHQFDDEHFTSYWGKTIFFERTPDDDDELEEPVTNRAPQFGVWFTPDEVEEIPEYDPRRWNEWPDVTPPIDILMRVETYIPDSEDCPEEVLSRFCAYWDEHGRWVVGKEIFTPMDEHIRFRPWYEEDAKDDQEDDD